MMGAAYQMPQIAPNYLALDQLNNSNLVTAKTSSYYCLTPASSTTSLNDLSNSNSLLESFTHANNNGSTTNNKRTKRQNQGAQPTVAAAATASTSTAVTKPQNSRKRLKAASALEMFNDGSTIENQIPPMIKTMPVPIQPVPIQPKIQIIQPTPALTITITSNQTSTSSEGLKRKRGRPPKSTTKPAPVVASPSVEIIAPPPANNPAVPGPIHVEPTGSVEKKTAPNKLLKPFFSKNISNLQRSKISDNREPQMESAGAAAAAAVASPLPQTPMPNLNWANGDELWKVMKHKEAKYKHDHTYLRRHAGIEPQMRAILIDWLVEIAYAYRLHRETLHLALEYMDRFMSQTHQQMQIDRLQLIGITSLFLAAKVEEIYPPKLRELASHMENYSSNNEEAISQFELFMLKTLNWEISPITANTWLMAYLQIASINYHSYLFDSNASTHANTDMTKVHGTYVVMPLHVLKTLNQSSGSSTISVSALKKEKFYLNNYMKSITLLDLCMFDVESMKYAYSQLAAAALYHMLVDSTSASKSSNHKRVELVANLVHLCTAYRLSELDACIKWMQPYADVCKEIITEDKMTTIKQFSSVEQDDWHNIQLYYQNLDLLVIFFIYTQL